jgi:hypothetical protein
MNAALFFAAMPAVQVIMYSRLKMLPAYPVMHPFFPGLKFLLTIFIIAIISGSHPKTHKKRFI